jgi:membrane protein
MSVLGRLRDIPGRVDALLQPIRASLLYRAWQRYGAVRGNVLAGGIAYFAFFSVFPALAIGFTLFALVLGNQEDLQAQLVHYINSSLGSTVISYHSGQGGVVSIEQLVQPGLLTTTGVVGVVTLVFTGLGWVGALRDGIQVVFAARNEVNFVVVKLFDVVLFLAAGLAVLTSVVVSVAVNVASGQVLDLLGITRNEVTGWSVSILGQIVLVVLDTAIFTLLFHRLCGVDVPWRDVAGGAFVAAVGFSVLKLFATELLQAVSRNRFLASFGVIVGLLVWMNLVARLVLVGAAWSATVAEDRGHLTPHPLALVGVQSDPEPAEPTPEPHERRGHERLLLVAGFAAGALTGRVLDRVGRSRRRRRRTRGERDDDSA